MSEFAEKAKIVAMYRRWAYMATAIIASALLTVHPPFSFHSDEGFIYVRSFSMTLQEVIVTQTELKTGIVHDTEHISVIGLYYCYRAMLIGSFLCLLCFIHVRARKVMAYLTIAAAVAYYVLLIIYALQISGHYATLAPTWTVFLPAIVLEVMALLVRNLNVYGHYFDDVFEEY